MEPVAGYSRGLATHHFGNKAGLLRALAGFVNSSFMTLVLATHGRQRNKKVGAAFHQRRVTTHTAEKLVCFYENWFGNASLRRV